MQTIVVQKKTYRDSVSLMLLSEQIRRLPGIVDVAVLMGTPSNKARLIAVGYERKDFEGAGPEDLCIGIEAENAAAIDAALLNIKAFISGKSHSATGSLGTPNRPSPRTLRSAVKALPGAQVVSISLPGEYAAAEARRALEVGLHVFLFSDHVSIQDEKTLKVLARERGLLLMGPDCGTALINGFPLGFCNLVSRGPVGIVAASGTGAQELMSLVASRGIGVSHVLGTGGRDLHEEIGGLTFETAMAALDRDTATQALILISKPPDPAIEAKILSLARRLAKPVVISFVGRTNSEKAGGNVHFAENLYEAAQLAASLIKHEPLPPPASFDTILGTHGEALVGARAAKSPIQRFVRGLYSGGTLADETALVLAAHLPEVRAGNGFGPVLPIQDWDMSHGNVILDLGDDRFTSGRPHPMIDPRIRVDRLLAEAHDPTVSVIMLDIILGLNADEDPARSLAPAIEGAREMAASDGRSLSFLVHICGTELDPQNLAAQTHLFQSAGSLVFQSNFEAALAAAWLVQSDHTAGFK